MNDEDKKKLDQAVPPEGQNTESQRGDLYQTDLSSPREAVRSRVKDTLGVSVESAAKKTESSNAEIKRIFEAQNAKIAELEAENSSLKQSKTASESVKDSIDEPETEELPEIESQEIPNNYVNKKELSMLNKQLAAMEVSLRITQTEIANLSAENIRLNSVIEHLSSKLESKNNYWPAETHSEQVEQKPTETQEKPIIPDETLPPAAPVERAPVIETKTPSAKPSAPTYVPVAEKKDVVNEDDDSAGRLISHEEEQMEAREKGKGYMADRDGVRRKSSDRVAKPKKSQKHPIDSDDQS